MDGFAKYSHICHIFHDFYTKKKPYSIVFYEPFLHKNGKSSPRFSYVRYTVYVTGSGKTGLIVTITDIHFLPVRESCTHALPRNTKYLIIVGQVCFYRRLFTDAVKPPGCISLPWRALIGLHGVPGCSSRQSWPPLWIVSVCATN